MGGGYPISGVIGKKMLWIFPGGSMSSTHSANPLSCFAGMAVLDEIIKRKLTYQAKKKGEILFKELSNLKNKHSDVIDYICGRGLIAGIIFKKRNKVNDLLKKVCIECMKNGVLVVYTGRESIKLGPPISIKIDA